MTARRNWSTSPAGHQDDEINKFGEDKHNSLQHSRRNHNNNNSYGCETAYAGSSYMCNSANNNHMDASGTASTRLEEENFYLRTQLQSLLKELRFNSQMRDITQEGTQLCSENVVFDASWKQPRTTSKHQLAADAAAYGRLTGGDSKAAQASDSGFGAGAGSTWDMQHSLGNSVGDESGVQLYNSNEPRQRSDQQSAQQNSTRSVVDLEHKLEALERKYELQAARHRHLTNELTLLRRTGSMDQPTDWLQQQQSTSHNNSSNAVNAGNPQPSAISTATDYYSKSTSTCAASVVSRAHSNSPGRGHLSFSEMLTQTSCASNPGCSSSMANDSCLAGFGKQQRMSNTCGAIRSHPSADELLCWMRKQTDARLFRALFQYVPLRDSPNDNPECELALEPGDYVLVTGDLDEDLFYEGRLFDGTIGLVPSNYVERVDPQELYGNYSRSSQLMPAKTSSATAVQPSNAALVRQMSSPLASTSVGPAPSSSKGMQTTSVGSIHAKNPTPNPQPVRRMMRQIPANPQPHHLIGPLTDVRRSTDSMNYGRLPTSTNVSFAQSSFVPQVPFHHQNLPSDFSTYPDTSAGLLPSTISVAVMPDSVCPYPPVDVSKVTVQELRQVEESRVPFPRELFVERQLTRSVMISWSPPENSLTPVSQYHVCVDGSVKAVVPGNYKCKALVEDIDLSRPRRISIRCVTDKSHSPDASCTVTVGRDAAVAPGEVRVLNVSPISAQLTWYPSNSNAEHVVLLNGLKVGVCPPGVFQVSIKGLSPSTMYRVAIRAKDPRAVLEERPVERCIDFKTLPKIGLPDAPVSVQVDPGPQDGTLLVTWRPVENQPKPPSRAAVAAYLIYADGRKIMEIPSPTCDHVLMRLSDFADDPPLFVTVRTKTKEGAVSADSNVVRVPRSLAAVAGSALSPKRMMTGQRHHIMGPGGEIIGAVGPSSGLLMVQPSSSAAITMPTVSMSMAGGTQQPIATMQPATGYATMWPGSQQQQQHGGATVVPSASGQYYVFHPKLCRTQSQADEIEKPSLLEMENSYLVKQTQPTGALMQQQQATIGRQIPPILPQSTNIQFSAPGTTPFAQTPATAYGMPALIGALQSVRPSGLTRALPIIDPNTNLPFRADQYAQAWQTLSPATRRRLEQYVTSQSPLAAPTNGPRFGIDSTGRRALFGGVDYYDMNAPMSGGMARYAAKRRADWRKRSYSADAPMEDYGPTVTGAYPSTYAYRTALAPGHLPHIQITGASGSEGQGSVCDAALEEDWRHYRATGRPSARHRRSYYQDRANSRTQSEPDLRLEERLMNMFDSGRPCRFFVALFDYNHMMSPNPNAAQEELSFRKGQVLKVYGEKDADGFYYGEVNRRLGLVPSNMVCEIDKDEAYQLMAEQYGAGRQLPLRGVNYPQPDVFYPPADLRQTSLVSTRRRSDVGWQQNNSDPALAKFRQQAPAGYSDYDSSASYGPAEPPLQDPRIRRMRWGSFKSRSYDHAESRRPRPTAQAEGEYRRSPPVSGRGYSRHGGPQTSSDRYRDRDVPSDYERDSRRYEGPYSARTERDRAAGEDYYRGSLDRRGLPRDHSLPSRQPPLDDREWRRAEDLRRAAVGVPSSSRYNGGVDELPYDDRIREPPPYDTRYPLPADDRDRRHMDREGRRYPADERDRLRDSRDKADGYDRDRAYPPGGGPPLTEEQPRRRDLPPTGNGGRREMGYNGYGDQTRDREAYAGMPKPETGGYGRPGEPGYQQRVPQPQQQQPSRKSGREELERNMRADAQNMRRMMAKFDYDSRELSPNVDGEQVELSFRQGDIITVFGEVDEDGFYIGECSGQRGLVPSNFLEPYGAAPTQLGPTGTTAATAGTQQLMSQQPQQMSMGVGPGMADMSQMGLMLQQQHGMMQPQRPKGVTFPDNSAIAQTAGTPTGSTGGGTRVKQPPVRQSSQSSTGTMGVVKMGAAGAGAVPSAQKAAASGARTGTAGGAAKTPAKKSSDASSKASGTGGGGARKTSQATGGQRKDPGATGIQKKK